MAYEYDIEYGLLRLVQTAKGWLIELRTERSELFASADSAIAALLSGTSGLALLARHDAPYVPSDLLRWRPTEKNL